MDSVDSLLRWVRPTEIRTGDYWIIGFADGDEGVSYTVGEILANSRGELQVFVPGSEVEEPVDSVDVWVRKVEMP